MPSRFHSAQEATATATAASVSALSIAVPPAPALRAVVVIPVKDEADNLPATLAALAAQVDASGQPLAPESFEIIVLANNCQDQSGAVVRAFARQHPALAVHVAELLLPPHQAHIGWARRLLMDEACRRLERVGCPTGYIASTDGDTHVAPTWLAATQAELTRYGAAAVCGRILTRRPPVGCLARRHHLRDAAYHLLRARLEAELDPTPTDPWPRHHQHFGASFAVTAAAYRLVGGLPTVPYLEDVALFQALLHHDLPVRHSPAVRVFTSARQEGRVAVGLSWQLREWAALSARQQEPMVASPQSLTEGLRQRQQLRQLWREARTMSQSCSALPTEAVQTVALALGIEPLALALHLQHATSFGMLWDWVEQDTSAHALRTQRWPLVPLAQALRELRHQLASPLPAAA